MSVYRIVFMPTAREELLKIGEYIALDNPERAITFIDELMASLTKTLSLFPKAGRLVSNLDFNEETRVFPHGNYNSYYRINEAGGSVEVLYILNAKIDMNRFLGKLAA